MEKKYRIPRKKKKQIPIGPYCYKPTSDFKDLGGKKYGFTIKCCPFYHEVNDLIAKCRLLNYEVIDQVKSCSERWGKL